MDYTIPGSSGERRKRQHTYAEYRGNACCMSIVQNTQFTGTDQEAEAGEQQYHLCLTSKSRLRATVSKASAWITGPCSRSRHTFSPYHHRVLVHLCVRVSSAHGSYSARSHQGRPRQTSLPDCVWLFFLGSRRVYYYSPGKVQCTSMPRKETFPSRQSSSVERKWASLQLSREFTSGWNSGELPAGRSFLRE